LNESEPIALSSVGSESIKTVAVDGSEINGLNTYSVQLFNDFTTTNLSKRGFLLSIDEKNKTISFVPSMAVPVVAGIKSHDSVAESFYSLLEGENRIGVNNSYLSFWTGFASSDPNCGDFYGNRLFNLKEDSKASNFGEKCVSSQQEDASFGFRWFDVLNNQYLFQKTVFYLPYGAHYSLKNACSDGMSVFAVNNSVSSKSNELLSLDSLWKAETLGNVLDLIGQQDVCVHSSSEGVYSFYWNEQRLEDSAKEAESAIESLWGVNLDNYSCKAS